MNNVDELQKVVMKYENLVKSCEKWMKFEKVKIKVAKLLNSCHKLCENLWSTGRGSD